ncbi:MAG: winged helix-turn-helix transcriptional regulator [Burkholderiales bacterium]|nr:winged helix-turn-helix transcriptional regulator [Burkholderiales bacterium]MCC7114586.1 winged helix-turn-helix transcriptional regulator [Burkholderiales bacterium]
MANLLAIGALADPTRRAIYESIGAKPNAVGEIAARFPVTRPAVSQHLKVLREAGLVVETRAGTRRLYTANPATALELRDYFQGVWERALRAYAEHVATEESRHGRNDR